MVAGQDLTRRAAGARPAPVLTGIGSRRKPSSPTASYKPPAGGLGLLAFGPISARFGRRRTFIAFHLLAFAIVPITCFVPQTYWQLLVLLPVFGFLTLAIHAGYAIYFPELFPTHLRATGASFCFNGGRVVAVPVLLLSAWLKARRASTFAGR